MCSGPTQAQKDAQQAQTQYTNQLMTIMKQEFSTQQSVLNYILPQLQAMATNPQGFGATEYKALQTQLINNVGAQFAGAQKAANEQFAVSNEAGLPSGVQAQVNAQIAAGAAGTESSNLTNLAIQNEALKQQQQQYALSGLSGIGMGTGSQALQGGAIGSGSAAQQFNEATQLYNQGNAWQGILGGVIGTGLNLATGGLSGLLGGAGNFFSGAGASPRNPGTMSYPMPAAPVFPSAPISFPTLGGADIPGAPG